MIKILVADDHTIFRQGLVSLLEDCHDIEIISQAANGNEALKSFSDNPDIAILDIDMPDMTGIELTQIAQQDYPNIKILLLTMHNDIELINNVVSNYKVSYMLKDDTFYELITAIRRINRGNIYYSASISKIIATDKNKPKLSDQEREVLVGLARGGTNKIIARAMDISPRTVETYRKRLMIKLDLHTVAELTNYAIKMKLV